MLTILGQRFGGNSLALNKAISDYRASQHYSGSGATVMDAVTVLYEREFGRQPVRVFKDDREMYAWLHDGANIEALRAEYPDARYTARVDLVDRKVFITLKQLQTA